MLYEICQDSDGSWAVIRADGELVTVHGVPLINQTLEEASEFVRLLNELAGEVASLTLH